MQWQKYISISVTFDDFFSEQDIDDSVIKWRKMDEYIKCNKTAWLLWKLTRFNVFLLFFYQKCRDGSWRWSKRSRGPSDNPEQSRCCCCCPWWSRRREQTPERGASGRSESAKILERLVGSVGGGFDRAEFPFLSSLSPNLSGCFFSWPLFAAAQLILNVQNANQVLMQKNNLKKFIFFTPLIL